MLNRFGQYKYCGVIFDVKTLTINHKAMKTYIYFIFLFLVLASCKKNDDPDIMVTRSEWYLERMNNGGAVHLIIEGSTNADKITILTHGDGLASDKEIALDSKNQFSDDVIISFSITAVPTEEFTISTDLKIYKKTEMITLTLKSGKLKY